MKKKKREASIPNGSDGLKNDKDMPAQFDEAWFKKNSRTVWLVKWDTTNTGYHCVLQSSLSGKNAMEISKSFSDILYKYQVHCIECINCDFKEYFRQRVEERGAYLCPN